MKPRTALPVDLDRTLIDLQSLIDYEAPLEDVRARVGLWPGFEVTVTDWMERAFAEVGLRDLIAGHVSFPALSTSTAGCPSGQWERTVNPSA